jgi:hypothetical protein
MAISDALAACIIIRSFFNASRNTFEFSGICRDPWDVIRLESQHASVDVDRSAASAEGQTNGLSWKE